MSAWCRPSAVAPPSWCWRSPGPSPSPHPRLHRRTQSLYLAELCMTSFTNLCNLLHTTLHLPILLKCGTRTPCNNVLCDKICGQKLQSCGWKYLVQSFSWFSSLKWTVWDLNVTFTLFYNLWCSKELQSVAAVTRQRSAGRGRGGNQWAAAAAARARHQTQVTSGHQHHHLQPGCSRVLTMVQDCGNVGMNFIYLQFCQDFVAGPGLKRFRAFSRIMDALITKLWILEYLSDIRTQHTAGRIFWTCSESMMKCMSLVIIKSMTDSLQSESVCCKWVK